MKTTSVATQAIRRLMGIVLAFALSACGGGGASVPFTGVQIRPLSADFTSRSAISYSPYRTSLGPGDLGNEVISQSNILQDLNLLMAAGFRLIRLFDSSDKVARQTLQVIRDNHLNMKVQLGAYVVSGDDAASRAELARCVALANEFPDIVLAVSVGNETMVNWSINPIAPSLMADYIRTVRGQVSQPVTTDDNYAFWSSAPTLITDQVDFVSIHTYAELDTYNAPNLWNWEQRNVATGARAAAMMDAAIAETERQYQQARDYLDSKGLSYMPITVGETGWNAVDLGKLQFRAHPVNQKMFLDRLRSWAFAARTGPGPKQIFYFEAFDEPWKQADDGWGLFNKDRQSRYAIQSLNPDGTVFGNATWTYEPGSYTDADATYWQPQVVNQPITTNQYTLYTDNAPGVSDTRPSGLRWDAFDGTTVAYSQVTGTYGPGDANHSLQFVPRPAPYGWGILLHSPTNVTENLSEYSSGSIHFQVSSTYPGRIEIGIATNTQDAEGQEAYLQIAPGQYGYCNTGAWCSVSIPVADFLHVNPKLDLDLVLSRFVLADRYAFTGNAAGNTTPLYVDGIYWSK